MNGYPSRKKRASNSHTVYGFRIDKNSNEITYLEDAVGMTPAHMDYENGVFDYGSWENTFFMPRPCMLKYDGTVDYYLDPDDYSKKADGTPSDIEDLSYPGNAMMEWGKNGRKIWIKLVPSNDHLDAASIYISDTKVDSDYSDLVFRNSKNEPVDHFYTGIYRGTVVDGKLRSMSYDENSSARVSLDSNDNVVRIARNNTLSGKNVSWDVNLFIEYTFIKHLLILMFKSLDFYEKLLGKAALKPGKLNDKGLFNSMGVNVSGNSQTQYISKVFGMEGFGIVNYYQGLAVKKTNRTSFRFLLKTSYADHDYVDSYFRPNLSYFTQCAMTSIRTYGSGMVKSVRFDSPYVIYPIDCSSDNYDDKYTSNLSIVDFSTLSTNSTNSSLVTHEQSFGLSFQSSHYIGFTTSLSYRDGGNK